jgi:hypothetical protein
MHSLLSAPYKHHTSPSAGCAPLQQKSRGYHCWKLHHSAEAAARIPHRPKAHDMAQHRAALHAHQDRHQHSQLSKRPEGQGLPENRTTHSDKGRQHRDTCQQPQTAAAAASATQHSSSTTKPSQRPDSVSSNVAVHKKTPCQRLLLVLLWQLAIQLLSYTTASPPPTHGTNSRECRPAHCRPVPQAARHHRYPPPPPAHLTSL